MSRPMKHRCVSGFRCECGTWQFLKKQGAGAAIKKLLKIFLFIFSIYLPTKIFLKKKKKKKHITMALVHKTTKEEGKKHKTNTQNKKENTKEATNIQNKIEK